MNMAKMQRRLAKADPEKGNCIQLYDNEVRPFKILEEPDQKEVAVQFFRWFLNISPPDETKMSVPAWNCLQMFIDAQKEHAVDFFERSEKTRQVALKREADKKARLEKLAYSETVSESIHKERHRALVVKEIYIRNLALGNAQAYYLEKGAVSSISQVQWRSAPRKKEKIKECGSKRP